MRFQSLLWWIAVVNAAIAQCWASSRHLFQSLLWWIAVVNYDLVTGKTRLIRFQSLLWWIAVVNRTVPRAPQSPPSFNPCCGGLQSSTMCSACGTGTSSCFNPCCGGLQSSTTFTNTSVAPKKVFQSLLWWIAVVNKSYCTPGHPSLHRVSILVVVDCSRQPGSGPARHRPSPVSILVVVDCSRQRRPVATPIA